MDSLSVKLDDVRYNPAEQAFEARGTVFGPKGEQSYACAIEAPITMDFETAAEGLATQAKRRYLHRGGLHSKKLVQTRPRTRRKTNVKGWLMELLGADIQRAA